MSVLQSVNSPRDYSILALRFQTACEFTMRRERNSWNDL